MSIEFETSALIPATPEAIYAAWLDSTQHTAMTGGEADVNGEIGGAFTAWDGYIQGRNLELSPFKRIVQAWRTVDFSEEDVDSKLEVELSPEAEVTRLTLRHTDLPADGMKYKQGWQEAYFDPMMIYFGN